MNAVLALLFIAGLILGIISSAWWLLLCAPAVIGLAWLCLFLASGKWFEGVKLW